MTRIACSSVANLSKEPREAIINFFHLLDASDGRTKMAARVKATSVKHSNTSDKGKKPEKRSTNTVSSSLQIKGGFNYNF